MRESALQLQYIYMKHTLHESQVMHEYPVSGTRGYASNQVLRLYWKLWGNSFFFHSKAFRVLCAHLAGCATIDSKQNTLANQFEHQSH